MGGGDNNCHQHMATIPLSFFLIFLFRYMCLHPVIFLLTVQPHVATVQFLELHSITSMALFSAVCKCKCNPHTLFTKKVEQVRNKKDCFLLCRYANAICNLQNVVCFFLDQGLVFLYFVEEYRLVFPKTASFPSFLVPFCE